MNSRRAMALGGFLVLALLLVVFWATFRQSNHASEAARFTNSETPMSATKDANGRLLPVDANAPRESRQPSPDATKRVMEAYSAPIAFYGKVVDESGSPVAGAAIKMMVNDKPLANSSVYQHTSDIQGFFFLHGAKGAALSISVSKVGYYSTAASKGRFVYGGVRGGDEPPNPAKNNPAIFVLREMGETVPLIAVDRDVVIPKDGRPVEISLRAGRAVPGGQGDIVVECWTNNEGIDPNQNERFDWRMRLTVPNGGLVERRGEFAFVAPETGYRPSEEMTMPKNAETWRSTFQRDYFLKTRSGSFARINVRMTATGGHFINIKAHLNPTPGSRNLEFDPAKAIASLP
jgi:hypothetical protein